MNEVIAGTGIYYINDVKRNNSLGQEKVMEAMFSNLAKSMAKLMIKRKDELPKEDLVFLVSCQIGKLADYDEYYDILKKEK